MMSRAACVVIAALSLSGCDSFGWNAMPQASGATGAMGGGMGSTITSADPQSLSPASVQATPLAPAPFGATPKDRLVAAIEDQGCVLTSANVVAVLTQAGLTQDELLRLAPELASEGRAEVSGSGSIRVLTSRCA